MAAVGEFCRILACHELQHWPSDVKELRTCCSLREFSVHHELRAPEVMLLFSLPLCAPGHLSAGLVLCHVVNCHPSFPPETVCPSLPSSSQVWVGGGESQPRRVRSVLSPGARFWLFSLEDDLPKLGLRTPLPSC